MAEGDVHCKYFLSVQMFARSFLEKKAGLWQVLGM